MKRRDGFTLVEIVIVLAIISIGVTVATTNFFLWQNHYSGVGFQREFLSLFGEARTRSIGSSFQHRLLINQGDETVHLQRGNLGTASTAWTDAAPRIVGVRGAGVNDVVCTPTFTVPAVFALVFNPDGEVLFSDNAAGTAASPLTQADIHLSAGNAADRATIRVFGWTSKARLIHGW